MPPTTPLPPHAWRSRRGRLASTALVWGFGAAQLREVSRSTLDAQGRVAAAPAAAPAPAPSAR